MEFCKAYNPYDFANPVSEKELFAGRSDEIEQIEYYLKQAKYAPKPINIALIGPRASGKTSFLNIIEIMSNNLELCPVRIDLDESDVRTQLTFFQKLYDCILATVCERGAFAGIGGKTYDTYLNIVNSYEIPEDKTFCPFLFPFHYAKAMAVGNIQVQVSDFAFKKDLPLIQSEIGCPIILLFDECNVLNSNKELLQKLRNIFMNSRGFMLVFTGTQELFPLMDEVFSPIVRQFKKINIGAYNSIDKTKDCIKRPLDSIEANIYDIFDAETYKDISEIHDISGGRPYEIQLICHFLFKRIQEGKTDKMILDLSVLEDVRRELESSQDVTTRPILVRIRNLSKSKLILINFLCACDGRASTNEMWNFAQIFSNFELESEKVFYKDVGMLIEQGIIHEIDGKIKFSGDDFDKIYSKYYAREQEVSLSFPDISLEDFWVMCQKAQIIYDLKDKEKHSLNVLVINENEISGIRAFLENVKNFDTNRKNYIGNDDLIELIYNLMIKYSNEKIISIIYTKVTLPWIKTRTLLYFENPNEDIYIKSSFEVMNSLKEKVEKLGGEFEVVVEELEVVSIERLSEYIVAIGGESLKKYLYSNNFIKFFEHYDKENYDESAFYAWLCHLLEKKKSSANNLGYLLLISGRYEEARRYLEEAIRIDDKEEGNDLITIYNLAMLELKEGNTNDALDKLEICETKYSDFEKNESDTRVCVYVADIIEGNLCLEIINVIEFREAISKSRESILKFIDKE